MNSILHFSQRCKDSGNIFPKCKILALTYKYVLVEAFSEKNITIKNITDINKTNYKISCNFNDKPFEFNINKEKTDTANKVLKVISKKLK